MFDITATVVNDVRKAASIVAGRYPGRFDPEDISQAIHVDIMSNSRSYERAFQKSPGVLFSAYKRAGFRYVQRERTRYLHFSDQYMYSSEEIKDLLPEYFATLGDVTEMEESRVGIDGIVISYMDLDSAYSLLRDSHKKVLAKKYHDDEQLTRNEMNMHGKAIKLLTTYTNENISRKSHQALGHEGPRVGNRPKAVPDWVDVQEVDALGKVQRIMESIY